MFSNTILIICYLKDKHSNIKSLNLVCNNKLTLIYEHAVLIEKITSVSKKNIWYINNRGINQLIQNK